MFMQDCVNSAGRFHIYRWYTILDAYNDSALGICDEILRNTKYGSQKRQI